MKAITKLFARHFCDLDDLTGMFNSGGSLIIREAFSSECAFQLKQFQNYYYPKKRHSCNNLSLSVLNWREIFFIKVLSDR